VALAVDLEDLRRRVTRLTDEQLVGMVTLQRADYRPEMLALAAQELCQRGLSPPPLSQPPIANTVSRLNKGEDIIAKGCLSVIGLGFIFAITASWSDNFTYWFWPGVWGWIFAPLILAGTFGAAGWLIKKLRRQP
jgi:hypothetical protein